jgi:hypothetical protein
MPAEPDIRYGMAISATLLFGPRREQHFLGRKFVQESRLTIISVG